MVLEELVCRMVVDSRFEVAILDTLRLKTLGSPFQKLLSDVLAPVRGIDAKVEDNTVRECPVVRDTEQDEADDVFPFQVKQ